MIKPHFLDKIPIEQYHVAGRPIIVCRTDLVPQPPLPPYLKMLELYPFLKMVKARGYKTVGYYAVPQSEWLVALVTLGKAMGIKVIIGIVI
mgnify:FL=1